MGHRHLSGRTAFYAAGLASILAGAAFADPVTIPKGMSVPITLQQHVSSGYVMAGSPVYFMVESDVSIGGQVVIRKGTHVVGKMDASQGRGRVGKSGSMAMSVRSLEAVDGAVAPIDADFSKQGRSRTGATVAWILFWGIPGLLTRGVNPYVERGVTWDANLIMDVVVDPAKAKPAPVVQPSAGTVKISAHEFAGLSANKPLQFNIEKDKDLKTVKFSVDATALPVVADSLDSLRLVAVDGAALAEAVSPSGATSNSVSFNTWSVVRFCADGSTQLTFQGTARDGTLFGASYALPVKIKKKS